jgi:galactonate dehydratase
VAGGGIDGWAHRFQSEGISYDALFLPEGVFEAGNIVPLGLSPLLTAAADPSTLKIRRVDAYVLKIGRRSDVVCARVENAEGLHGWGEGTTPPNVQPVVAQIRSLANLLTGQSAWDIEKLWRRMYIVEENTLGGTLFAGMSAIDIALWDIVGKQLKVPVYKLLGGKIHDRLRIYTSYRWGEIPRTANAYRNAYAGAHRAGCDGRQVRSLRAVSRSRLPAFDGRPQRGARDDSRHPRRRAVLRYLRRSARKMEHRHGRPHHPHAGAIRPVFLGGACAAGRCGRDGGAAALHQHSHRHRRRSADHWNFRDLLNKQAARIIQPDVARTGGITSMKKIAAMADANYVTVAPYNPNGPICTAASMHVAASIPNFVIMEEESKETAEYNIVTGGWKAMLADWGIPDGPGREWTYRRNFCASTRSRVRAAN